MRPRRPLIHFARALVIGRLRIGSLALSRWGHITGADLMHHRVSLAIREQRLHVLTNVRAGRTEVFRHRDQFLLHRRLLSLLTAKIYSTCPTVLRRRCPSFLAPNCYCCIGTTATS